MYYYPPYTIYLFKKKEKKRLLKFILIRKKILGITTPKVELRSIYERFGHNGEQLNEVYKEKNDLKDIINNIRPNTSACPKNGGITQFATKALQVAM